MQYAQIPKNTITWKHYKSPLPGLNVHCRQEAIATDTVFADTPSVDNGSTSTQIFVGIEGTVDWCLWHENQQTICKHSWGCYLTIRCTYQTHHWLCTVEISNRVHDILYALAIGDWQSEPLYQHQNFAEHHWQTIKRIANTIMDRTGSPSYTWLLTFMYTFIVCNHTTYSSMKNRAPLEVLTGSTPDICPLLCSS